MKSTSGMLYTNALRSSSRLTALAAIVTALAPLGAAHAAPNESATSTAAPPPSTLGAAIVASTPPTKPTRGARIGAEVLGGSLALGLSVGVGYASAYALADRPCTGDLCGLGAAVSGGAIGLGTLALTMPLAVMIAGDAAGGTGHFLPTLAGSTLGLGAGLGLAVGVSEIANSGDTAETLALGTGLALTVAGAILGYELSTDAEPEHPSLVLAPSIGRTEGGAVFGLAAAF